MCVCVHLRLMDNILLDPQQREVVCGLRVHVPTSSERVNLGHPLSV